MGRKNLYFINLTNISETIKDMVILSSVNCVLFEVKSSKVIVTGSSSAKGTRRAYVLIACTVFPILIIVFVSTELVGGCC